MAVFQHSDTIPEATNASGVSPGPPHCNDTTSAILFDGRGDHGCEIVKLTSTFVTINRTYILDKSIEGSGRTVLEENGTAIQREHLSFHTTTPSILN